MKRRGLSHAAPGKIILLGEHSVVYGHRAIAAAVELTTRVTLEPHDGPTWLRDSFLRDARLDQAIAHALPSTGWAVDIGTDLPVGRGMGSSAALSIALVRAAAAVRGENLDFEEEHRRGFDLERIFHGNPSGLDHAVSALGGAVVYRRGEAPLPIDMPRIPVVVLDTGVAGDTAALVAGVAARRPGIDESLDRLGALVEEALPALGDAQALGQAMNEAQHHLEQIGVSNPGIEELVRLARKHGALGAKLSGAGGGGIVVALTPDGGDGLLHAARRRDIPALASVLPAGSS
jgi:mevalonate kinase